MTVENIAPGSHLSPGAPTPTLEYSEREEGRFVVYEFRGKSFRLDREKARERKEAKRVINGLRTAELNVLPLKYPEAYRLYKQMKANHWEPDVIDMTKDCVQWNSRTLKPKERWIIEMGAGYFSAAEGIVGDSVLHAIEDNLTAAELKPRSRSTWIRSCISLEAWILTRTK